jgi:2-dehydropantoate 2-reductase
VRFIVYGAGAVGGVVGGRLAEHGHDVVLIARGAHAEELRRAGLTIESPDATSTVDVPVARDPSEIELRADDVVLLAMKSQDTHDALLALRRRAGPSTPVVCLQNGVDNERAAVRLFENVYGVNVMCPAGHLQPLYGRAAPRGPIGELVRAEGRACLQAAGIAFVSPEEDRARRGDLLHVRAIGDRERPGGSTWQSLARRTGAIETDYLNGEIVLLGRLHGVPTPANELLRQLALEAAAAGAVPGSLSPEDFLQRLGDAELVS